MAQIVTEKAISTRCNLIAIQAGGRKENTVLAEGEIWLVDTTNASKIHGYGRYDSYIVGDGTTAAKNLTVNEIDDLTALSNRINTEVSTRADMDDNLQDAIDAEADARQAADNLLHTDLTAEATSRQSADTALQTSIQDETAARIAADALKVNKADVQDINSVAEPMTSTTNPISAHAMGVMKAYVDAEVNQTIITPTEGSIVADNATIESTEIATNVQQFGVKNGVFAFKTEVDEVRYLTGKNLLDVSLAVDGFINRPDGRCMTNPTDFPDAKCSPIIKVQEGKTYTISGRTDTAGIVGIDAAGNRVKVNSNTYYALSDNNGSFVVPNGVVAVQFTLVLRHALTSGDKIQLEEGAVATDYEEYHRTPINEAFLGIQSEVQHITNEVTDLKNTNSIVLENMLGSPINVPNFNISENNRVSGSFNKWLGFSRYVDRDNDGLLTGVSFSGSLSSDKHFNARVSRKVRDGNTITGLVTMYTFSFILPANSSSYSLDVPLPFGKDCVLELYIDSLPTGSTLIRYKANPDASEWVRYDNQQVASGSIYNFNAVVRFFYNYQDSAQLKKIKILSLGNSHSEDAFSYVPFIVKTCFPQIDLTFGILYFGGCSLQLHEQHFDTNGDTSYIYRKILSTDNAWQTISSGTSIQSALADEDWDIIVLQQNSSNEANYATFQPYLNRLIRKMQAVLTKPVRFAWHFPEVPSTDYDTSVTLFGQYATNVQRVLDETPVSILFPSSAGLQNARTTALQSLGGGGNMLYTDNHAQEGIPCYCLALPNALVIADLCGLGYQGIYGDSNIPTASWVSARAIPNQNGSSVGATEDNCKIAQLCAIMAHKNPLEITDMTDLGIVSSE